MVEIGLVVIVIMGLCWYWESKLENIKQEKADKISELYAEIKRIESKSIGVADILKRHDLCFLVKAPDGDTVENGLPVSHDLSELPYGEKYTVYYTSETGVCFHTQKGCHDANILSNIHIEKYYRKPCNKCCKRYEIPDTSWVDDYITLEKFINDNKY